jgi:hypothetical protein
MVDMKEKEGEGGWGEGEAGGRVLFGLIYRFTCPSAQSADGSDGPKYDIN